MKIDKSEYPQNCQSVSSVLRNTGVMMQILQETIQDVEMRLLEKTIPTQAEATPSSSLQVIDLFSQSIVEIALLLDRLSNALPETVVVDVSQVIDPIRLEKLRSVIGDGADPHLIDAKSKSLTDISLF
jgi:hypothetical protein